MKTCAEVSYYMVHAESMAACRAGGGSDLQAEGTSKVECTDSMVGIPQIKTTTLFIQHYFPLYIQL